MKIKRMCITNFRGYRERTEIKFDDITVFVGRNDIGKSTILEALDLFFNDGKGTIKYDKGDICVSGDPNEYTISVEFSDIPEKVVLDSSYETVLAEEFLLTQDGTLEVVKKFNGAKNTKTFIKALHPSNPKCNALHAMKKTDLKAVLKEEGIACDNQNVNAIMRKAIWERFQDNLELEDTEIDVASGEGAKEIWDKLAMVMPVYSLFQSDRQNNDNDKEVQDPLKLAVTQFFQDAEIQETLKGVAEKVEEKLKEVASRTLEKIKEMDPTVASSLNPSIPPSESLKWAEVFTKSVSITSDGDIPINKRGSGVKRLVLLNFFRAEAERRQAERNNVGIIYALEEPETSQHFANQRLLIDALINLSKSENTQVILTTHSGIIVKGIDANNIRIISREKGESKVTLAQKGVLNSTSLDEINYTVFGEITEAYHDELYGYILEKGWLAEYEKGKPQRPYIRVNNDGTVKQEKRTDTHYIRDVMHHPENKNNPKYTITELGDSIDKMRLFIESKNKSQT